MNKLITRICVGLAVMTLGVPLLVKTAAADTMNGTYYTVSSSDLDFGSQCCGFYTNMVQNNLGPDGLPVLNSSYGGPTISDVNSSGEITWWSPSFNPNVTASGTNSITLPFSDDAMYPPEGQNPSGSDANGFLTAEFTGTLSVPTSEQVTFSLGSDDDSFLFLNGALVTSSGGVHGDTPAPVTSQTLAPGNYSLALFYADRFQTQAALDFSVTTQGVVVTPPSTTTPEPASLLLLGTGLLGLAWIARRKEQFGAGHSR